MKPRLLVPISWLFVLLLASCAARQPENVPPRATKRIAEPPAGEKGVSLKAMVRPLPRPNAYEVHLEWRGLGGSQPEASAWPAVDAWTLRRVEMTGGTTHTVTLERNTFEHSDPTPLAGRHYRYYLSALTGPEPRVVATADVSLPRDLEIQGVQRYTSIHGVRRLFFAPGAKLLTYGEPLDIVVDEILSTDGTIMSFPPGAAAPVGKNGRHGGHVHVRARTGTGHLFIEAHGENGGQGYAGQPGVPGVAGSDGKPGDLQPIVVEVMKGEYSLGGGDLASRTKAALWVCRYKPSPAKWQQYFECKTRPTDGNKGGNGGPGGEGYPGKRGGNTASYLIEIAEASSIQVHDTAVPGSGGAGGAGGKGGEGGPGGLPGALDEGHLCPPASQGPRGEKGVDGPAGKPGESGGKEPRCLKLGTATLGECEHFEPRPTSVP